MTIEQYFNQEKLNVKNLSLETPKTDRGLFLHPDIYVSDGDWNAMRRYLEENCTEEKLNSSERWNLIELAVNMKILFPERLSHPNIDHIAWNFLKRNLEQQTEYGRKNTDLTRWGAYALSATKMRILFPERVDQIRLDKYLLKAMNEKIEIHIGWFGIPDWYVENIWEAKILFPDETFGIRAGIREYLENTLTSLFHTEGWDTLVEYIGKIRVLFPDFASDIINTYFNRRAIDGVKEYLNKCRIHSDWKNFSKCASFVKFITAREVKITNQEIIFSMPDCHPFKDSALSVPEARKF